MDSGWVVEDKKRENEIEMQGRKAAIWRGRQRMWPHCMATTKEEGGGACGSWGVNEEAVDLGIVADYCQCLGSGLRGGEEGREEVVVRLGGGAGRRLIAERRRRGRKRCWAYDNVEKLVVEEVARGCCSSVAAVTQGFTWRGREGVADVQVKRKSGTELVVA